MTALAVLLILAAAVAWWGARRARGAADFFAAGHAAGAWIVGIGGTAAALSAFTFVGGPGLFWAAGAGSLWIILSAPLTGALQCWAVGEPVTAIVQRERVVTIPALLGAHFGSLSVQGIAAAVVAAGCVASLAVQVRAAAVLGEDFLGVPGAAAAVAVMAATTLYMALGGMRSGLLADAVQGTVMAVVAIVLAVAALAAAGGPSGALRTLVSARPQLLGSFGAMAPGRAMALYLLFCVGTCAQPHYIQKFFFLRSGRQLRHLPAVLTLALALTLAVWIGVGLGGTALATSGAIGISRADDLAPRTMTFLGPWAVVLAGAGILAAMMSTAASYLNIAAAAAVRDLPQARGREPHGIAVARAATVAIAAAATALGLSSERTIVLLGVAGWGFFTAALLPVMTAGLASRKATASNAAAAMIAGGATDLVLELFRAHLPVSIEPGLAGAAVGALALALPAARLFRSAAARSGRPAPAQGAAGVSAASSRPG